MKALSMSLLFVLASFVFSSFKPLPAAMTTSTAKFADGTLVGYQIDGTSYAYFFSADLSASSPYPITQISVSRLSGESLAVVGFSGSVVRAPFLHFNINGTATVTFIDNGTTVTKNLTGFIEGGIIE
ncbi:hypothetical protein [Chitinophaga filiformis]|uniref:Uncharacterized protein n=1 Tax=Chitinophaga filiformis TaxID=104663 RepID=A0A1G7QKT3_CHIFI|nr:hypothetical protein [Chitinophaga filiformis]SDF99114.1 hypothetical protein SAMN04488121_10396 [Chitinophaga filiformis]